MSKKNTSAASGSHIRWTATIFAVTFLVSGLLSLISDEVLQSSGLAAAFAILLAIVLLGILFDMIGVAAASADERPFHAMASRKVPGAREAIRLLRNADRVSSVCNDVIGDICGIISGSASAVIAVRTAVICPDGWQRTISLLMSACVAALTVGGKSFGKTIAMDSSTRIMHLAGRVIWAADRLMQPFRAAGK